MFSKTWRLIDFRAVRCGVGKKELLLQNSSFLFHKAQAEIDNFYDNPRKEPQEFEIVDRDDDRLEEKDE